MWGKVMKRFPIVSFVVPILLISNSAYAVTTEVFRPAQASSRSEKVSIVGNFATHHSGSQFGFSSSSRANDFRISCLKTEEGACTTKSFVKELSKNPVGAYASLILPYCAKSESQVCLEDVAIENKGLTYIRDISRFSYLSNSENANTQVVGSDEIGMPEGGLSSLWEFPENFSGIKDSYLAVTVRFSIQWQEDGTPRYTAAQFQVTPFVFTDWSQLPPWVNPPKGQGGALYGVNINGKLCKFPVFLENQQCPQEIALPEGIKIKVVGNLPANLGGWFNGRIDEPRLTVVPMNSTVNRVEIEGKAIRVPRISVISKKGDEEFRSGVSTIYPDNAAEDNVNKVIDRIRPLTQDRATGSSVVWNASTVTFKNSKCLQSQGKLLGVVTSNALTYQGSAPKMEGGYLTYQLSGMKYEKDGSLTRGNYNLVMRSEVARCLFSLDKKLIRATVSIIYPDNSTKNVATENFGERNGWVYIQATNFTFSNPKVRVALKQ